ncbi:MAG: pilus assembly protein PilZ [Spirochaetaceae bacterium]|jgi:hypothetical protein|nr:pilus assembly protein PilZ [Spirochaetaceae bacterium]
MSSLPRQKINDYYDQFKSVDVTFTKEVIQITGLVAKEIQLKCTSDFFPCVIYSTSFEAVKVVANNKSGLLHKLKSTNNVLSIRFFFKLRGTEEQVVFLVPARVTGTSSYGSSPDMSLFTLVFSARPPDDLIEIMGCILEANMNFTKRKDERLTITPDAMRKMSLKAKDIFVVIDASTHRCVLREVFFSGARLVMLDKTAPENGKLVAIRLEFDDPREECILSGKIVKFDTVTGNDDMYVITVVYTDTVPMSYKVRLNNFLTSIKMDARIKTKTPDAGARGNGDKPPSLEDTV